MFATGLFSDIELYNGNSSFGECFELFLKPAHCYFCNIPHNFFMKKRRNELLTFSHEVIYIHSSVDKLTSYLHYFLLI